MDSLKNIIQAFLVFILIGNLAATTVCAYDIKNSPVNFIEFDKGTIKKNQDKNKPYYLLFSAQWCFWCKAFEKKTLVKPEIYNYLNDHFINVFIDADIHGEAYRHFKAVGLPFTVFLNPDGSLFYKYSGAVWARDFLGVIKDVNQKVSLKKSVPGMDSEDLEYEPPDKLPKKRSEQFTASYIHQIVETFDSKYKGVGFGEKAIMPETFLFLLRNEKREKEKQRIVNHLHKTMRVAIQRIYDPLEGGFFRYAEKRDWKIPHFEKMSALNSGALLVLQEILKINKDPQLKEAAERTLQYLARTLYDDNVGSFLSFQEADEHYYLLNRSQRQNTTSPGVAEKIFTERLAKTLFYLLDVEDLHNKHDLDKKVLSSLKLLGDMIDNNKIYHFFDRNTQRWQGESDISDTSNLARLFKKAYKKHKNPIYQRQLDLILNQAKKRFLIENRGVFGSSAGFENNANIEFEMEMNGNLAIALAEDKGGDQKIWKKRNLAKQIRYYSRMDIYLSDHLFDAKDLSFLEHYPPYINALNHFQKP